MKTIWKFVMAFTSNKGLEISMPKGAKILCVQVQDGVPCIWALVNPKALYEKRTFDVYGTGWDVYDDPGKYIGTYQLENGALVFHVFERTK